MLGWRMKLHNLIAAPSSAIGRLIRPAPRCSTSPHLIGCYAICTAFVMTLFVSLAQAAQWSPFWDALAARADAKVIDGVNGNGEPTRRIELPSGVTYFLERHGDRITSLDGDMSGHGAVQCNWEIYLAVRIQIDACSPGKDPNFEADLDAALDRINDFIVENSLVPITKQRLVDAIEQRKRQAKLARLGVSEADQRKQCEALAPFIKAMTPRAKLKSSVDDLLSVKRPPVMNPCL